MKDFLDNHPKLTRAMHTFWQSALASFFGSLGVLLPVIAQYKPAAINWGVLWSGMFGAVVGALGAGFSALKSLSFGVPEEKS